MLLKPLPRYLKSRHAKFLRIMKITVFILLTTSLQLAARTNAQTVTLSLKNVNIQKVFKEISKQTGVSILYNEDIFKEFPPCTIDVKNAKIDEVLDNCLKGQPFRYSLEGGIITVEKKLPKPLDNLEQPEVIIKGKVTDEEGAPLEGVSVIVVGKKAGTSTDASGNFSVNVEGNETLRFSYIGFETIDVRVNNKTGISVKLIRSTSASSDIVVVGYGTQKKGDLTGSVSSVKGEDVSQLSTQRVDEALQGRAAGVMVQTTDGSPGGNTTIRIRGMNSISGGNNALIVIDGLQGGDLKFLNPADIESVEILKDASATAIYGAQGANGVILITTKKGKTGKPVIAYSYSFGLQKLRKKLKLQNAVEFANTVNAYALAQNGINNPNPLPLFSEAEIDDFKKTGGTDWQDVIYRTAPMSNHELSLSGGTANLKYFVSGGYLNQDGILLNSNYNRFSLRANFQADITDKLNFNLNWFGTKEAGNSPPFGSGGEFLAKGVNTATLWAPTEPVYDSLGNYSVHRGGYGAYKVWNPLASVVEPDIDNSSIRNMLNAYLEYKPLPGLSIRITGGANVNNTNNKIFYNRKTLIGAQAGGKGISTESMFVNFQNSNIITYDKTIGEHRFIITGVGEQQFLKYKYSSIDAGNFLIDQTGINDLGSAKLVVLSSDANQRVLNSYLGRINYFFADKYLLTASYRADGSSVFGENNKWGYFPSASVAWRASKEAFISRLNIFSDLKFRASWGITGNQAISPYQTLPKVLSGRNYDYNGTDQTTDLGVAVATYGASAPNPSLKWESTTQINFGIDVGLFGGRLNATVDYYTKTTNDLLMSRTLPVYTGFRVRTDNIGSIRNRGIEIAISGDPVVGKFRWNTGFNISANRNKVLSLGDVPDGRIGFPTNDGGYALGNPLMYLVEGEPYGQMYGYGFEGIWGTDKSSQAAIYGELPGDEKWTDVNKDSIIDVKDLMLIGNAFPKFIFGWNNSLTYKNFELNFLIQGSQGNDIFNMTRIRLEGYQTETSARLLDRWTPEHQNTDVPGFVEGKAREQANLVQNVRINNDQRRQRWVEDGSYVRLKNITLSYNLPRSFTNRIKMKNLKAYISGVNLITITNYSGYDPEVSSWNDMDSRIGVDFNNYPQQKIITVGLNVSL